MARKLTLDTFQIGASGTPAFNFVLRTPAVPDGTISLKRGNVGAESATIFTIDANGLVVVETPYLYYREEQTSGTQAGTFTSGAWQTRVLNTEVSDAGGHGSLSSNQVTLAAGTYRFRGRGPADRTDAHQMRLANVTDSIYYLGGNRSATAAGDTITDASVSGRFTIASSKVFELQHRAQTTHTTTGLGYAHGWGTEVYAELEFWKVG